MGMMEANPKTQRHCVFCVHWYDPTNSVITPPKPGYSNWKFESHIEKQCMRTNHMKKAYNMCVSYKSKI